MAQPPAEIEIDDVLVRTLLVQQHPDLAELPLRPIDAGWDNALWRLGDALIVRLPRRFFAAGLTLNEQRWLPVIAGHLPLPVPRPLRVGRPSRAFPWPWSVVPYLAGTPGDVCPVTDGPGAARQLAAFLRALHVPAPPDAPSNPLRGSVHVATRAEDFERLLANVGSEVEPAPLRAIWRAGATAPGLRGPAVWLHADLHPANVLTDHGALAGIVDFGDMCAGDRANDLAAAWILLPDGAAEAFFDAYGPIDRDTGLRARAWAALLGLMLLDVGLAGQRGRPGGKATWTAPARAALQRLTR